MGAREEIEANLDARGVFVAHDHPKLRRTAQRLVVEGILRNLLPGISCRWQDWANPETRLRAAACWLPGSELIRGLTGGAA